MLYNESYTKNSAALKRCQIAYNCIFIVYASFCIPWIAASLFGIIITRAHNELYYLFDGIIIKLAILFCGTMGCYKHNSRFALAAPIIHFVDMLIFGDGIFDERAVIMLGIIVLTIFTVLTNKKYHYLEQCDGFPYFNERFEASNEIFKTKRDIYAEQLEEIKNKHTSDTMDEI